MKIPFGRKPTSQDGARQKRPLAPRAKMAITSTSITIIIVACVVLLNVVALALTDKYPISIDLTANKLYEISDETIAYISALQKDVTIYVLAPEEQFAAGNKYYQQVYQVLKKYPQYSPHISLQFVDLAVNPSFVTKYPQFTLNQGSVLVTSGDNATVLDSSDLFIMDYDWSTYSSSVSGSNAEQAITAAILTVTSENKPLVAVLTGHGEFDTSSLTALLEKNGFQTKQVALLTESLPTEAQVLLLAAPATDLSQEELDKLQAFLTEDSSTGRHLIYMASVHQSPLPLLEGWLARWGIVVGQGVVAETNPNRVMSNNAYYGLANLVDRSLTGYMKSTDIPLILPLARPLTLAFSSSMGYSTSTLMQYSETAGIADENTTTFADIQVSGPIIVAARAFYGNSSILVYGSEYLVDASLLQSASVSNEDYILSVFNTLCQRESGIQIPSKTFGASTFMMPQGQSLLLAGLFIIVLPLAVLVTGFVVWFQRRRL